MGLVLRWRPSSRRRSRLPSGQQRAQACGPAARSSSASAASSSGRRPGDQGVEVELAVHVEVDEQRDVALRVDGAVIGAEDALVGLGQRERIKARGLSRRRQADDHRRATERRARRSPLRSSRSSRSRRTRSPGPRLGVARRTVSVAPTRAPLRAWRGRCRRPTIRAAPREPRALDHATARRRRSRSRRRSRRRHRRGVAHGADARGHRAADDRHDVQRRVVADLGPRPTAAPRRARRTRTRRGSGGGRRPPQREVPSNSTPPGATTFATTRTATAARLSTAGSAPHCGHPREDHVVADLEAGHVLRRAATPRRRPRGRARPASARPTRPRTTCRSEPHTPAAAIRTSTSPARRVELRPA